MWNSRKRSDAETRRPGEKIPASPRRRVPVSADFTAHCSLLTARWLPPRHAGSTENDRLSAEFFLQRRHGFAAAGRGHSAARLPARRSLLFLRKEVERE